MVSTLRSPARRAIVGCLDAAEAGLTAAQLAQTLDLHVTTVRFHLNQLIAADLVATHTVRSATAGRPNKVYQLIRESLTISTDGYDIMADLIAKYWRQEATEALPDPQFIGAQWAEEHLRAPWALRYPVCKTPGIWLAKVGTLVDMLDSLGFDTEVETQDRTQTVSIHITNCPYLGMAKTNPEVLCNLHRGLLRGALNTLGEEQTTLELLPFVTSTRCSALLRTPSLSKGVTP